MVLIGNERHSELWLVLNVFDRSSTPNVTKAFRYSQLTDLVDQICAAKLPETHVLDAAGYEFSGASGLKVHILDLEWQRV